MNTSKQVIFKKQRELGSIIGDTFSFLRRNVKPIFSVLVRTCSIPFILLVVAVGFYTKSTVGVSYLNIGDLRGSIGTLIVSVLTLGIMGVIYNAMLYGSVSEYIKAYIVAGNVPDTSVVVNEVKKKTSSFIGLGFANLLIIIIALIIPVGIGAFLFASGSEVFGFLLMLTAFIPMIYFYVRFSVIYPVFSNKNLSIADSFKKSGHLVKNEWWMTLITIIIITILISIIGFVFQLPATIYILIKTFASVQSGSLGDPAELVDNVSIILQTLASSVSYILYVILAICINFIYHNLNERKTQSGSLDQIDQIGTENV